MSYGYESLINDLEQWAPKSLAEDWDNVGLQVGDATGEVSKVLVALTPSMAVVNRAIAVGADTIITHHPFLFRPLKQITTAQEEGKIIKALFQHNIRLYSAHTNLDIAVGGVNDVLAEQLGLQQCVPLEITGTEQLYKLVVYVPQGYEESVRKAMCDAGAGFIGNYSDCTFRTAGTGTFLAQEGCNPFLGEVGTLEEASEYRLETVVPQGCLSDVLKAMTDSHPYEEVAYDLFRLENKGESVGLGRVGFLEESMDGNAFLQYVSERLQQPYLTYAGVKKNIQKVAICGGSGTSLMQDAAKAGADAFITGDMKFHDGQSAEQLGLLVIDAGHFATEHAIVGKIAKFLSQYPVEVVTDDEEEDFLKHYMGK